MACEKFPEAILFSPSATEEVPVDKLSVPILKDFNPNDILHFFGDDMHPEGNDYPLKKEIIDNDLGFCYNVKDYKETWKILRDEFSI